MKAREGTTHITTPIATQITTQIISESIIELVTRNLEISRKKLAEVLGDITEDGIKYHLDKLKEEGIIERVGGTRGKWKILKTLKNYEYGKKEWKL